MTNISAEKAAPLQRLNGAANGYLAEEEGREARSLEKETWSLSDSHYRVLSEPKWLVHMLFLHILYVFACMWVSPALRCAIQLGAEVADLMQSSQAFCHLVYKKLFVMLRLIGLRIWDTGL